MLCWRQLLCGRAWGHAPPPLQAPAGWPLLAALQVAAAAAAALLLAAAQWAASPWEAGRQRAVVATAHRELPLPLLLLLWQHRLPLPAPSPAALALRWLQQRRRHQQAWPALTQAWLLPQPAWLPRRRACQSLLLRAWLLLPLQLPHPSEPGTPTPAAAAAWHSRLSGAAQPPPAARSAGPAWCSAPARRGRVGSEASCAKQPASRSSERGLGSEDAMQHITHHRFMAAVQPTCRSSICCFLRWRDNCAFSRLRCMRACGAQQGRASKAVPHTQRGAAGDAAGEGAMQPVVQAQHLAPSILQAVQGTFPRSAVSGTTLLPARALPHQAFLILRGVLLAARCWCRCGAAALRRGSAGRTAGASPGCPCPMVFALGGGRAGAIAARALRRAGRRQHERGRVGRRQQLHGAVGAAAAGRAMAAAAAGQHKGVQLQALQQVGGGGVGAGSAAAAHAQAQAVVQPGRQLGIIQAALQLQGEGGEGAQSVWRAASVLERVGTAPPRAARPSAHLQVVQKARSGQLHIQQQVLVSQAAHSASGRAGQPRGRCRSCWRAATTQNGRWCGAWPRSSASLPAQARRGRLHNPKLCQKSEGWVIRAAGARRGHLLVAPPPRAAATRCGVLMALVTSRRPIAASASLHAPVEH